MNVVLPVIRESWVLATI